MTEQPLRILGHGNRVILTLADWLEAAPPAGREMHWKDGRSAKELARRWVGGVVPKEVRKLLETSEAFRGFVAEMAHPETRTVLDARRGNTRNHDLLVIGKVGGERVVLDIEGKADESFGPTVAQRVEAAKKELERKPRSGALERVQWLCGRVLRAAPEEVGEVRYQLVHAVAAAVNAAREVGAARVAWVVHEFRSAGTSSRKQEANARDLDAFVARLGGSGVPTVSSGRLVGPLRIGAGGEGDYGVDVYIGKAVAVV